MHFFFQEKKNPLYVHIEVPISWINSELVRSWQQTFTNSHIFPSPVICKDKGMEPQGCVHPSPSLQESNGLGGGILRVPSVEQWGLKT
jgi:hypothetical protein